MSCDKCYDDVNMHVDNRCYDHCPFEFYAINTDTTQPSCEACGTNCKICEDDTTCSFCLPSFNNQDGVCQATCNDKYWSSPYENTEIGPICRDCPASCDLCDDFETCTLCSDGFSLHQNDCLAQCPLTYYSNVSADPAVKAVCTSCGADCQVCDDENFCRSCSIGFTPHSGVCQLNPDPISCSDDKENCLNCDADNKCLNCFIGFAANEEGECEFVNETPTECPADHYTDINGECQPCTLAGENCAYCYSDTECSGCSQGFEFALKDGVKVC